MAVITYELIEGIGRITLNRPEKYNSFTRELALALQSQLDACGEDQHVRVIYLTGAGKAFCAGQDLGEVVAADGPSLDKILLEHLNPIIERLRGIEKPIVAAVNGVAAGAGANIAIACDIAVAAESASFIQAFSRIGLIPDSGGTFFLPRLVGLQRAAALMMLGEKLSARDAAAMGMIYRTFPDEAFADAAWDIARQLAQLPALALALTKRALNRSLSSDLANQLAIEETLQTAAGQSEDFREGVAAFLEKRAPRFKGVGR